MSQLRSQVIIILTDCRLIVDKTLIFRLESSRDMDNIRKALARGLFMNIAQLTVDGHYVSLDTGHQCYIHPQSVLFQKKPEVGIFMMIHKNEVSVPIDNE